MLILRILRYYIYTLYLGDIMKLFIVGRSTAYLGYSSMLTRSPYSSNLWHKFAMGGGGGSGTYIHSQCLSVIDFTMGEDAIRLWSSGRER